jgi:uncharacterized protein involved in tolerance to divalent cations
MRYYILNAAGDIESVQSMTVWGEWFAKNHDARVVAKTEVGEAEVSTVFLAIDHSHGGDVPILFETMVFDGPHDNWVRRYATKAEAQAGHDLVVEALRAGQDPDEVA